MRTLSSDLVSGFTIELKRKIKMFKRGVKDPNQSHYIFSFDFIKKKNKEITWSPRASASNIESEREEEQDELEFH